ncbi:MAG TPA: glutamyl-tRNA reductase, partial [Burkholderiaceae bacterium]|nr:glutamyl-tRNA reductase [Burkholderiaceae bacterium]
MYLLTLGLNHQTAPLALREKVSFPGDTLGAAIGDLRRRLGPVVAESAILSTCNRTEIYCATPDPGDAQHSITHWLGAERALDTQPLQSHL